MKQLTCEMCGSTDLMKQEGVFVCQSCGTKYSVEEAKKMMSEDGDATVNTAPAKNNVQLENLLNLARSSFDSKNYAQAEEFCNQVIAIDGVNYEAWKLKGEAINYQINAKNQRILEVYNCIMTSFRVLSDEDKAVKKYEIISSLKTCFEGEVDFWLKQFEAARPTDSALTRAKNAYVDAYNKMKSAFEELGLESSKNGYLTNFDNFFIEKCSEICASAWKTTVGYNYYRDYMGQGIDPFYRTAEQKRWIIANTDLYRPAKNTWDTFLNEADNLIDLLKYAEKQFNDETDPKTMEIIYSNIAYIQECIIPSGSWKITQGYTSNWDQYKSVGWHEEYNLTDQAKELRKKEVTAYKAKAKETPKKAAERQRKKEEKERNERIAKYWKSHADEKAKLDAEKAEIEKKMADLDAQIAEIDKKNSSKIKKLKKDLDKVLPCDEEVKKQNDLIRELENQKASLGLFKGKEKKAIQAKIDDEETPKLEALKKQAEQDRKAHQAKVNAEINVLKEEGKDLRDEVTNLKKRNEAINKELTKDRK